MRCEQAHGLLGAYLDSELGSEGTLSLVGHLEVCPACAELFRWERQIESRIQGALSPPPAWDEFWKGLEEKVSRPSRIGRPLKAMMAAAAALLVAVSVWHANRAVSTLAAAAITDHRAYLQDRLPLQVASGDPEAVLAYVKTSMPEIQKVINDPNCRGHEVRLVGATACHLDGVPAILVAYQCCNRPVSVFVLRRSDADRLDREGGRSAQAQIARGEILTACVTGGHEDDVPRQLAQAWVR